MRKQLIENYKRKEIYNYFNKNADPFVVITTKIDITNVENYCKLHKHRYATIAWILLKALNEIDEMKVKFENGKFYKYNCMNASFTIPLNNNVVGFMDVEMKDNLLDFINEYNKNYLTFSKTQKSVKINDRGEIWFSCLPWMQLTSIVTPHDKSNDTQQIFWDKIVEENKRYYINLTTLFNHGYFDGLQLGIFVNKINNIIENFK